jgi:hypothetical protein
MVAAKHEPAKITSKCREESFNAVRERNNAMKPGERGKQKEQCRKPCSELTKPFQSK